MAEMGSSSAAVLEPGGVDARVPEPVMAVGPNEFGANDIATGVEEGGLESAVDGVEDGLSRGVRWEGLVEGVESGLEREESGAEVGR